MAMKAYDLKFNGYWRKLNIKNLPAESGIYGVYACTYNKSNERVKLNRLIYIGESKNVRERVKGHEKWGDWEDELRDGEEICFNAALILPKADRERAEATIIYKHKPSCNSEYVDEFSFDTTTINTSGKNSFMEKQFTMHPTHTAEEYYEMAGKLFDDGKYDKAIANCDKAIYLKPDYAEAWNKRGSTWVRKREWNKAIENLDEALRLNPSYALAWYNRGVVWMETGEYDKAINDNTEALRLDPNLQDAIHNRAFSLALKDSETERKASESERKSFTENIKKRFEEQIKRERQKQESRIKADTKWLRWYMSWNTFLSFFFRLASIGVLVLITAILASAVMGIYIVEVKRLDISIETTGGKCVIEVPFVNRCINMEDGNSPSIKAEENNDLRAFSFLLWMPVVAAISSPFFILLFTLQRWGYEAKTLAYGFQRKIIIAENIFYFSGDDDKLLKELLRLYISHWMEKSPLEVMLALSDKSVGRSSSSVSTLLDKVEKNVKTLNAP